MYISPSDLADLARFDAEQYAGPTSYRPDPKLKGGL